MSEKACGNCHFITKDSVCPKCKSAALSDDFGGLLIVFDVDGSTIAKAMKIREKGCYALKVR
ncbi:MAG: transcription elongation factor subunit Spt4 [Candidatus Bathyarchaeia archaeon]